MTSRLSNGDYTTQIFAYERDTIRLLQQVQLYVAAGNALHGAVFLCRFSGQPSAIESRAITAASSTPSPRLGHDASNNLRATAQHDPPGELTLTLIQPKKTFRFNSSNNRFASPKLTWPDIYTFFTPGAYVDIDLILKDQFLVSPGCFVSRGQQLNDLYTGLKTATDQHKQPLHISCTSRSDATRNPMRS